MRLQSSLLLITGVPPPYLTSYFICSSQRNPTRGIPSIRSDLQSNRPTGRRWLSWQIPVGVKCGGPFCSTKHRRRKVICKLRRPRRRVSAVKRRGIEKKGGSCGSAPFCVLAREGLAGTFPPGCMHACRQVCRHALRVQVCACALLEGKKQAPNCGLCVIRSRSCSTLLFTLCLSCGTPHSFFLLFFSARLARIFLLFHRLLQFSLRGLGVAPVTNI